MTGRWYPVPPPALEGETDYSYTDRITGADGTGRKPYDHVRFRECSMGYHLTCSEAGGQCDMPSGRHCECPCHTDTISEGMLVFTAAAAVLSELYYLPDASAQRVMAVASTAYNTSANEETVRLELEKTYQSEITDWFVTDVLGILKSFPASGGTFKSGEYGGVA